MRIFLIIVQFVFCISVFVIFWAMIGYSFSLKILSKIYKKRKLVKDYDHVPTVTVMVVAHNEEAVMEAKLKNITELDYPEDKIEFLISSDNSTDRTNEIVTEFIEKNGIKNMRLFCATKRMGKTNAQNEAQKTVTTEFLVMTDANSMLEKSAVKELMAAFASDDVAYVTGCLRYINADENSTAKAENTYWNGDLRNREIESRIQTITAGNGALYACRNADYLVLKPIRGHDANMPMYYSIAGKRALFNPDAVVYEKAGEEDKDEYKRKVRMYRGITRSVLPDIRILNVFRCKWYSYFYFGHRSCRYQLWFQHPLALISSAILMIGTGWFNIVFMCIFACQMLFYLLALIQWAANTKNRYLKMIFYYCMTIVAQWNGVINIVTGKSKPFWEKAESTR